MNPMRKPDAHHNHNEISVENFPPPPLPLSPVTLSLPYFTIGIIIIHLLVFLYGLSLIGFDHVQFSLTSPISLPNQQLIFLPISTWPNCSNLKTQFWRFFSHQFVHAGLMHLLSNQCMTLLFGVFVEISHGFWKTLFVYEIGILSGALLHSTCLPYRGLIGCSHGVYALYGTTVSLCFIPFPPLSTNTTYRYTVLFSIFIQLLTDIFAFLFYFNPAVGYMAHIGGFVSGLLIGFVFLLPLSSQIITNSNELLVSKRWRIVISFVSLVAYLVSIILLMDRYLVTWPPRPLIPMEWYHWIIHNQNDAGSCCEDMFNMIDSHRNLTMSQQMERIQEHYYCDGQYLQYGGDYSEATH
jgi:membrane associated rhomboid family serine protease